MLPDVLCAVSLVCPKMAGCGQNANKFLFTVAPSTDFSKINNNELDTASECKLECLKRENCLTAAYWSYNNTNICSLWDASDSTGSATVCGGLLSPIIFALGDTAGLQAGIDTVFKKSWIFGCRAKKLTVNPPPLT